MELIYSKEVAKKAAELVDKELETLSKESPNYDMMKHIWIELDMMSSEDRWFEEFQS